MSGEYVAPRTEVEREVAAIWAEVLGVEEVGVHDNFFELGGHSLLATQIVSRLRSTFGVAIELREVFETPTVEALSLAVTQSQAEPKDAQLDVISKADRGTEEHLIETLDQLSDEEIDALLPNLLTEAEVGE
jgi:acyl carrier protein